MFMVKWDFFTSLLSSGSNHRLAIDMQTGRGRNPERNFLGLGTRDSQIAGHENSEKASVPWEGKYENGRVQRGTHTLASDRPTDHCLY